MSENRKSVLSYFEEQADYMNERIKNGVEQNRKGWFKIKVKDEKGNVIPNAKLTVIQKKHEFRLGSNIFALSEMKTEEEAKEYKRLYSELFNLATLPFYWKDNEPRKGEKRYAKDSVKMYRRPTIDECLEFCEEYGIEPKAHCLDFDPNKPAWVENNLDAIRKALRERFNELSDLYAKKIPTWEVTNENLFLPDYDPSIHNTPHFLQNDTIEWDFHMADRFFPDNKLIINESGENIWYVYNGNRSTYYMLIERALNKGCRIDSIGLQYHCAMREEDEKNRGRKTMYNPEHIYKVLDCYADFGLPMQITELSIPTYRYTEEDEDIQAEILKNLYSIWFSHPCMEGIINWDFVDGYEWNSHKCGFVRKDLTPKKSYLVLRDLFHKTWRTNTELYADNEGQARLKAFYGEYEITVCVDGKNTVHKVNLLKNSDRELTLVL